MFDAQNQTKDRSPSPMETYALFLTLGGLFFIGLGADQVGRRSPVPRVTLLLLCGLVLGFFDLLGDTLEAAHEVLSVTALTFVAFLLGGSLKITQLKVIGRQVLAISLTIVVVTILGISLGLMALGVDPGLAVILGGIASATAPAATTDVIRQSKIENNFTETLTSVVAVDDAWGLLAFSLCLSFALSGASEVVANHEFSVMREVFGALALGIVVGLPGAYITGRIREGEPLEIEALALVFVTAGLALWSEVSFLIAGMSAGATIANLAVHHRRAFHEIEHIQWPFMVLFFLLAGASLDVTVLRDVGLVGLAYMALRTMARFLGGWLGAWIGAAPLAERPLYGLALLPQAGVAVGMALTAARAMPDMADQIIAVTIGTTIAFELFGPILTLRAIRRSTGG